MDAGISIEFSKEFSLSLKFIVHVLTYTYILVYFAYIENNLLYI